MAKMGEALLMAIDTCMPCSKKGKLDKLCCLFFGKTHNYFNATIEPITPFSYQILHANNLSHLSRIFTLFLYTDRIRSLF